MERMVLLCDKEVIMPEDLPDEITRQRTDAAYLPPIEGGNISLERILENIEKEYLQKALVMSKGNKTDAAGILGLSFRSFRHRLHKYGIAKH